MSFIKRSASIVRSTVAAGSSPSFWARFKQAVLLASMSEGELLELQMDARLRKLEVDLSALQKELMLRTS